jgi:hypothetical protein
MTRWAWLPTRLAIRIISSGVEQIQFHPWQLQDLLEGHAIDCTTTQIF